MSDDINADNYLEKIKELEKKETADDVASINRATEKSQEKTKEEW